MYRVSKNKAPGVCKYRFYEKNHFIFYAKPHILKSIKLLKPYKDIFEVQAIRFTLFTVRFYYSASCGRKT